MTATVQSEMVYFAGHTRAPVNGMLAVALSGEKNVVRELFWAWRRHWVSAVTSSSIVALLSAAAAWATLTGDSGKKPTQVIATFLIVWVFVAIPVAFVQAWWSERQRVIALETELNAKNERKLLVKKLQEFYSEGSTLSREAGSNLITDEEIGRLVERASVWYAGASEWIKINMGDAAVARLQDSFGTVDGIYLFPGQHSAEARQARNNILRMFSIWLKNLEILMNSSVYDRH
jgi:hypothetical protein